MKISSHGMYTLGCTTVFLVILASFFVIKSWLCPLYVLRELKSPNGEFTAIITKQRLRLWINPVVAGVEIKKGDESVWEEIRGHDMWIDVDDRSYPIQWDSDSELSVGNRYGSFEKGFLVKIDWPEINVSDRQ